MTDEQGLSLPPISRRGFLGAVGVTAVVLALPGTAQAMLMPRPAIAPVPFIVRRREDLLRVSVTAYGMTIDRAAGTITVDADSPYTTINGHVAGRIAVDFGPQSVLEEAFDLVSNPHPRPPARARLSGTTRVVFTVPSNLQLTLESILSWSQFLTVAPGAAFYPDGVEIPIQVVAKGYAMPMFDQTAIEMPWWLIMSPSALSAWTQQTAAKTVAGRTEVFNTRLGQWAVGHEPNVNSPANTVRGVWIRDPNAQSMLTTGGNNPALGADGYPFLIIPTPEDRSAIVRLTTRTGDNAPGGRAAAVHAGVTLTPLGGHLNAIGEWKEADVSSVMSWQHRTWQGRDTYSKIVRRGFLYPWGLHAYLVEEGIRVWAAGSERRHDVRPYWFKRQRVGVTDPTVTFAEIPTTTAAGRRSAVFRSVICQTLMTPDLLSPGAPPLNNHGWSSTRVFIPKVNGANGPTPFSFSFVGIDANGEEVPFTMPLLFAEDKPNDRQGGVRANFTQLGAQDLRAYYNARPDAERLASFGGLPVGFADDGDPVATSLPTTSMIFDILETFPQDPTLRLISDDSLLLEYDGQPRNMPLLKEARTVIADVSRIAGQPIESTLTFPLAYAKFGINSANNEGRVFLQNAAATATKIAMDAAKAGAVIIPSMDLAGLSSTVGAVYGSAQSITDLAADGTISPTDALSAIELLGGVSLADILPTTFPAMDGSGPSAQALTTSTTIVDQGLATERAVTTMAMTWQASELLPSGAALGLLDLTNATLNLRLVSEVPTAGGSSSWSVLGSFNNFTVSLIPVSGAEFVYVDVAKLTFTAGSGKSSSVDVDIANVRFGAALAFLADLAQYLPFGDGLTIDIDATGIRAGLSIELPSIGLGAFTLSGIAVKTGITLPLTSGAVRFRFGMSSTDDPFGLTVMGLGGGGWFSNDLGLDGIEYFDAAAFVQAKVAVDFGVASGSVAVQMGMQYSMGLPEGGTDEVCTLTAFARIQGEVGVLGIVSIGIEVYLGLGIDLPLPIPPNPGPGDVLEITLHGEASCTVKVKVCFFSKKVTFQVKRSFKGSDLPLADYIVGALGTRSARSADTGVTFAQTVTPANWAQYCGAFA